MKLNKLPKEYFARMHVSRREIGVAVALTLAAAVAVIATITGLAGTSGGLKKASPITISTPAREETVEAVPSPKRLPSHIQKTSAKQDQQLR